MPQPEPEKTVEQKRMLRLLFCSAVDRRARGRLNEQQAVLVHRFEADPVASHSQGLRRPVVLRKGSRQVLDDLLRLEALEVHVAPLHKPRRVDADGRYAAKETNVDGQLAHDLVKSLCGL